MTLETIHTLSILKELPTDGHSPLLVMGSDFKMYVAKNDKGKEPPVSLINECLATFFLSRWQIETPKMKLIKVAKELIKAQNNLSFNHQLHYYDVPCFGSQFVENAIDINKLLVSMKRKLYNKINNPKDLFHLTLFDTWVENDDRKPTNYNLVLAPRNNKYTIIPIDNAYIFSTMSHEDLDPKFGATVSSNEHLLVSELGRLIKKNTTIDKKFVANEKEYFYLCLNKCQKDFDNFINQLAKFYSINPAAYNNLKSFLFNESRNNKVFEEYVYRLEQ